MASSLEGVPSACPPRGLEGAAGGELAESMAVGATKPASSGLSLADPAESMAEAFGLCERSWNSPA